MSVRLRLTLTYAGVLVGCGVLLLAASYGLVSRSIDKGAAPPAPTEVSYEGALPTRQQVSAQVRADALAELRANYMLALVAMAMGSGALGWLLAGRALRPLHAIAAATRGVDRDTLDRRVALDGPADELKDLADTIDGMLARLDGAFQSQQRFVANASHELRTPLAVIRAEVDVALADPDASTGELRATAGRVRAATDRSERLIESLLTLARSEAEAAARPEIVDLAVAADLGLEGVAGELRAAGIAVRRDLTPGWVRGDRRLIERLVANLIENAVRHNVPGGWIAVATSVVEGVAHLRVENSGVAVAPERVGELLEPFQRGSRHAAGSGAGLGLSIVRSVAEAHGGRVELGPRPGGGLVVGVQLPVALSKRLTAPTYAYR